jgi:ArsR family transcriptional regulator
MKQLNMPTIFKALANEQRLKLFQLIYEWCQELEACSIDSCCDGIEKAFTHACEQLKISRSTVSHHFKELQNAGLIICTRKGQSFSCKVNQEAIKAVQKFLD